MAFLSAARLLVLVCALHLVGAAGDACAANSNDCDAAALSSLELLQSSSGWVQEGSLRSCVHMYADGLDTLKAGLGDAIRAHPLRAVGVSDRDMVINAGSGTTGTCALTIALTTLQFTGSHFDAQRPWDKFILDTLGLTCSGPTCRPVGMNETEKTQCRQSLQAFDFSTVPQNVDFLIDTPVAEVFIDLFLAFPRAKWLLTTRDAVQWATARRMGHPDTSFAPMQEPCGEFIMSYDLFVVARMQEMQNDLVRCVVPPKRLLEFSVFTDPKDRIDNLMMELSKFLERPLNATMKFPDAADW